VLVEGQIAKRRLLLRAMGRAARDDRGAAAESFRSALATLATVERVRPAAVRAALGEPLLDAWASDCLRQAAAASAGQPVPDAYAGLAGLAAGVAARARMPVTLATRSVDGTVTVPGFGQARTGPGPVRIEVGPDRLTFLADGRRIALDAPYDSPVDGWSPYRRIDPDPGFPVIVEDLDPYRDCFGRPPADRLGDAEVRGLRTRLREAWRIVARWHPEHADVSPLLLRAIVPLRHGAGRYLSAASRRAFGAIATSPVEDAEQLALMLVHEQQHVKLSAVLDLVDLYVPGPGRYHAAWRRDPRPIGALLQGVYAHMAVADYWRKRRDRPGAPPLAEFDFVYWREATAAGASQAGRSRELTALGVRFVDRLTDTVAAWAGETTDPVAVGLVRAALTADAVVWRYRHQHASDVTGLIAAWRGGHDCPSPDPPELRDRPAAGEARLARLIRASWAARASTNHPATSLIPDAAEAAYLDGDHATAVERFAAQLRAAPVGPDAEHAWAGLALAVLGTEDPAGPALLHRPELVAAVSAAAAAEPVRVARWLGDALRR
jgi:uncharacterized protein